MAVPLWKVQLPQPSKSTVYCLKRFFDKKKNRFPRKKFVISKFFRPVTKRISELRHMFFEKAMLETTLGRKKWRKSEPTLFGQIHFLSKKNRSLLYFRTSGAKVLLIRIQSTCWAECPNFIWHLLAFTASCSSQLENVWHK